jgi:hypothetical protein
MYNDGRRSGEMPTWEKEKAALGDEQNGGIQRLIGCCRFHQINKGTAAEKSCSTELSWILFSPASKSRYKPCSKAIVLRNLVGDV